MFNGFQPLFPFRGEKRGFENIRGDGDQGLSFARGHKVLLPAAATPRHQSGLHQLFKDSCAGGGCAQPFAFRVFRQVSHARRFHSSQQAVLGIMLGRHGHAVLYRRHDGVQLFPDFQRADIPLRFLSIVGILAVPLFPAAHEQLKGHLPADLRYGFSFTGKGMSFAFHRHNGFGVFIGIGNGADQPDADQLQQRLFLGGKPQPGRDPHGFRGDDGVMVADFGIVDHLFLMNRQRHSRHIGQAVGGHMHQPGQMKPHILR